MADEYIECPLVAKHGSKICFKCPHKECIYEDIDDSDLLTRDQRKYLANKPLYIQRAIKWQKENPERAREIQRRANKRWYEKNKEHRTEYLKQYYKMKKEQKANDRNCVATDNSAT